MAEQKARRASDADAAAAPPRKRSGRRRGKRRSLLARLLYWGSVLGLWMIIAAVASLVFVASTLPPIQSLEVPKRPPTIEIVGIYGRPLVTRRDERHRRAPQG